MVGMNRQARLAGKYWFSFGSIGHADAAKRLVAWHDRFGELPEGETWIVETRDVDHPDTIMRHQVNRQVVYSVKCYRRDEANA